MDTKWEHFPHAADIGVRGIGSSLAEAFEMAAMAVTAVVTDPTKVFARESVRVNCEAEDYELLLYEWLNAVIFEMDTRRMLFSVFDITAMTEVKLEARISGETVDQVQHQPAVEVKGATMTELRVRKENGSWIAQCIVDV